MAGGFDSLGLMPELLRAVDDMSWLLPTDVQDEAIPLILGGGDVMAASETGSGKTAAFCLPILQCVYERLRGRVISETSQIDISAENSVKMDARTKVTFNPNDKDAVLRLFNDDTECISAADKLWVGVRATHGIKSGCYAYECIITGEAAGICRVGWSSISGKLDLGRDMQGYGYGGTAMKSNNNKFEAYGEKYSAGDVITCLLNWNDRTISYAKNGNYLGVAFEIPPQTSGTALFPAVAMKGSSIKLITSIENFRYPHALGSEYKAISDSNSVDITSFMIKSDVIVSSEKRSPLAIIIEPARDLAEQVYDTLISLSTYIKNPTIRSVLLVGGDDHKKVVRELSNDVDIVVGTTGKIMDLVKSKTLNISKVKFFILDEADRLIETDNIDNIVVLYNACNLEGKGDDSLQVCFFSATLHSPSVTELSNKICYEPTWVDLKGFDSVPETVHHVIYKVNLNNDMISILQRNSMTTVAKPITDNVHVGSLSTEESYSQRIKEYKQFALLALIEKFQMSQVMVFCRTNLDCDNLEEFLNTVSGNGKAAKKFIGKIDTGKENIYSCCVLAGMRSLQERRQSLDAFRDGYVRILICTDVAARGIDIKGLPYVINMTLPDVAENYIHRIGRVGRAECMGLAISIVTTDYKEKVWYHSNCQNKGKGCTNRKLLEDGGCTLWYNEGPYLEAIEKRLHMSIPILTPDFELPPEIASKHAEYGEDASYMNQKESAASIHLNALAPTVQELAELEILAQNSYFYMKSWNRVN